MRSKGVVDARLNEEYPLPYLENIPYDLNVSKTTPFGDQNYCMSSTLAPPSPTADFAESEIDYRIHYSHRMLYLLKKVIISLFFSLFFDFVLPFFS